VYGAIAPVVFLFRNEPIEFPLAFMIAAICGGFVGPAVALDSPDRGNIVIAEDSGPVWGAKRGVLFGVTFAVVLGVPMLIRGPAIYGGTTFLKIISVATSFGLVGGLCVGALRSFTTQYWSAVIVGSLGGVFAVAAVLTIAFGVDGSTILYSLVGGILIGARVGSMVWRKGQPESPA